jgi:hypothetical protein
MEVTRVRDSVGGAEILEFGKLSYFLGDYMTITEIW